MFTLTSEGRRSAGGAYGLWHLSGPCPAFLTCSPSVAISYCDRGNFEDIMLCLTIELILSTATQGQQDVIYIKLYQKLLLELILSSTPRIAHPGSCRDPSLVYPSDTRTR